MYASSDRTRADDTVNASVAKQVKKRARQGHIIEHCALVSRSCVMPLSGHRRGRTGSAEATTEDDTLYSQAPGAARSPSLESELESHLCRRYVRFSSLRGPNNRSAPHPATPHRTTAMPPAVLWTVATAAIAALPPRRLPLCHAVTGCRPPDSARQGPELSREIGGLVCTRLADKTPG